MRETAGPRRWARCGRRRIQPAQPLSNLPTDGNEPAPRPPRRQEPAAPHEPDEEGFIDVTQIRFEPDAALSLPQGQVAIMGPEPAVNAVYYNKIMELPEGERAAYVQQKREEYVQDVDIYKLASEMLVDGIIAGSELRGELIKRLGYAQSKQLEFPPRRNPVLPV